VTEVLRGKVLIVEDDQLLGSTIQSDLERLGLDVRLAPDGENGLELAQEWQPDLILLDLLLPGRDGLAVCAAVRNLGGAISPTIVMLTATGDLRSKLNAFEAGADDYLVKPIDLAELRTRTQHMLGTREVQQQVVKQRRKEAIRDIVTTICHELNNSLTVALGHLELVPNEGLAPEDVEHLAVCQQALLAMAETITRLRLAEDRVVPYMGDHGMIDLGGDADRG
jgi:DNA-binding response OmpR family regulator